jgi:DNA-binding GntR family transcriptional regulator
MRLGHADPGAEPGDALICDPTGFAHSVYNIPVMGTADPNASGANNHRYASHYAAQYIRRLVFEGILRPGQRIPQDEVAQALELSRIPVREAIIALEREGFVRTELHRGAFVSPIVEHELRDQYQLHGMVHGFAAERALERSGAEFIAQLSEIESRLAAAKDPAAVGDIAFEFHRAVVAAAKSPRLKTVFRSLPGLRPSEFFEVVPGAVAVEKKGIKLVLQALKRGDKSGAASAYITMMSTIGEKVVDLFRERGLFAAADDAAVS